MKILINTKRVIKYKFIKVLELDDISNTVLLILLISQVF
jgi:hypothetical protein